MKSGSVAQPAYSLRSVVLHSITEIDSATISRLGPLTPENAHYLRAAEVAPPPGFEMGAIAVFAGDDLVAAAPFFVTRYDLLLALNNPHVSNWLSSRWLRPKLLCLGSPLTETCPLVFAPELEPYERAAAFAALLEALLDYARQSKIRLTAVKDIGETLLPDVDRRLLDNRFHRLVGLPVAKLLLPLATVSDYLKQRSKNFRKDFNRAINKSAQIRIEHVRDISAVAAQVFELYEQTRTRGGVSSGDFDQISPAFISTVLEHVPSSYAGLYWLDGKLIGFSLILNDETTAIAKFIGLKYPEANQTGLYRRCLKDLVETAYSRGQTEISFGCLNYDFKVKSGCSLTSNYVYFRHGNAAVNHLFGKISQHFHYDAMDPDLLELAKTGQYKLHHPPTDRPFPGPIYAKSVAPHQV